MKQYMNNVTAVKGTLPPLVGVATNPVLCRVTYTRTHYKFFVGVYSKLSRVAFTESTCMWLTYESRKKRNMTGTIQEN